MLSRNKDKPPFIIGICGGSGSGKTYILDQLIARFECEVCLISQDHYYKPLHLQPRDEKGEVNFDKPEGIDREALHRDIRLLLKGEGFSRKEYTFNNPAVRAGLLTFKPCPVIIAEGLFLFYFPEIKELFHLKIFIDSSEETSLQRRLLRDQQERAYTREMILYQWKHHVMPAYKQYLLPYREEADVIIRNDLDHVHPDLSGLINVLEEKLSA